MRFLWDRITEMILGAGHQFIYLDAWREQEALEAKPRAPAPVADVSTYDLGIELMPLLPISNRTNKNI